MRSSARPRLYGFLLTLALGVAVLFSGFAHKMPALQDGDLAAFVLAGGDPSDICDTGGDMEMDGAGCDACRLVGAAVLPDPAMTMVAVERVFAATVLIPSETRAARAPRDPALGERAPPLA
ncbi:hypothetical protein FAZ78_04605 [Cereibacter changlensis]|uniref:DUF2946 domain-containing protein n=1 Tax=Cereibacter changlensis TaxID=402884 RepID=A0A4U0Z326_9RHOB|nr:hypothetical protein [Cereibacter changlensis]TKA97729.1 hypothetical protein FAZ78_04605 [Cereibacter changlensis]